MAEMEGRADGVAIAPFAVADDVGEGVVPAGVELNAGAEMMAKAELHATSCTVGAVPVSEGAGWSELSGDERVDRVVGMGAGTDVEGRKDWANKDGGLAEVTDDDLAAATESLNRGIQGQAEAVAGG